MEIFQRPSHIQQLWDCRCFSTNNWVSTRTCHMLVNYYSFHEVLWWSFDNHFPVDPSTYISRKFSTGPPIQLCSSILSWTVTVDKSDLYICEWETNGITLKYFVSHFISKCATRILVCFSFCIRFMDERPRKVIWAWNACACNSNQLTSQHEEKQVSTLFFFIKLEQMYNLKSDVKWFCDAKVFVAKVITFYPTKKWNLSPCETSSSFATTNCGFELTCCMIKKREREKIDIQSLTQLGRWRILLISHSKLVNEQVASGEWAKLQRLEPVSSFLAEISIEMQHFFILLCLSYSREAFNGQFMFKHFC